MALSADAAVAAFRTKDPAVVPGDTNGIPDLFTLGPPLRRTAVQRSECRVKTRSYAETDEGRSKAAPAAAPTSVKRLLE